MVVLPEPVPPEIRTLRRAFTTALSTSATCAGTLPISMSRSMLIGTRANLRIDMEAPSIARGANDRVDAAAVGEACVHQRGGFVDAAADRRHDLLDDPQQMPLVLEPDVRWLEDAVALDEHLRISVDQDIGDRRVLQERLDRPQAQQLVEDVANERLALLVVERLVLLRQFLVDDIADFGLDLLARHLVECLQIDDVQQPLVKLDLEIGMRVPVGERSRVADRDDAKFFGRLDFGLEPHCPHACVPATCLSAPGPGHPRCPPPTGRCPGRPHSCA